MLINNSKEIETVEISLKPETVKLFIRLFYSGVNICVQSGKIIKSVLVDEIGIDNDYAENRIQTVFLNAKAVDDISKAVITKNSTLALSAAMPGLVGATFSKGGY